MLSRPSQLVTLSAGSIAAIGAYTLFALSAPLTKWLIVNAENLGTHGGSAVSFCNLLTIGNLAAAAVVGLYSHGRRLVGNRHPPLAEGWRNLDRLGAASLIGTSLLAVVTPAMFFAAISRTSVANVILISRTGPIFYAVLASVVIGQTIQRRQWFGYGWIVTAAAIAMIATSGSMIGLGDAMALTAALGAAMVSIVGKPALRQMGLSSFVLYRNLIAAAVFATIALTLFGPSHFADLTLPAVVGGVAIYGVLVVGLAQLLWFYAITHVDPKVVGGWSFISPLTAVIVTATVLGEHPHWAQWLALSLVLMGMAIATGWRWQTGMDYRRKALFFLRRNTTPTTRTLRHPFVAQ